MADAEDADDTLPQKQGRPRRAAATYGRGGQRSRTKTTSLALKPSRSKTERVGGDEDACEAPEGGAPPPGKRPRAPAEDEDDEDLPELDDVLKAAGSKTGRKGQDSSIGNTVSKALKTQLLRKATLRDKSNAQTQPKAKPSVVIPRTRSAGARPAGQASSKLTVYRDEAEPTPSTHREPGPSVDTAAKRATKPALKEASEMNEPPAPRRAFELPTKAKLATTAQPSSVGVDRSHQEKPSQARKDTVQNASDSEGPFEEGMQLDQDPLPGRSAHDRLLNEVSAIGQAEGPSDMVIEDQEVTGIRSARPRTSSGNATHPNPSKADEAGRGSAPPIDHLRATTDGQPQQKKRARPPAVGAVERGRRFKRTVDDAALDLPDYQEAHRQNRDTERAVRRRKKADKVVSPPSSIAPSASPPGSPKRPRAGRRSTKASAGNSRRSTTSDADDLGLADAVRTTLNLRDNQPTDVIMEDFKGEEERDSSGQVESATFPEDTYSSPPPGAEKPVAGSSSGSSVKAQHRLSKKPAKRRNSKGIVIPAGGAARKRSAGMLAARMKKARAAALKAKGLPTSIAKEAPVLGDSDSSDDPMAI